jgi:hypothetical protein
MFPLRTHYIPATHNARMSGVLVMESATVVRNEEGRLAGPLYHSNQVAAFGYSETRATFASKVTKCVCRALDAIGASSATQQVIFWNLSVTNGLGQDEIVDKPAQFIEGLRAIYGEAVMVVYEYKLLKEFRREFELTEADANAIAGQALADVLRFIGQRADSPPSCKS